MFSLPGEQPGKYPCYQCSIRFLAADFFDDGFAMLPAEPEHPEDKVDEKEYKRNDCDKEERFKHQISLR